LHRDPHGDGGLPLAALVAGWFVGYIMALLSTAALVVLLSRARTAAWLERWVARDVPGVALAVPVFTGTVVGWTMLGLVLGALFELLGATDGPSGFGTVSMSFTIAMLGIGWLPVPPLLLIWRRYAWLWCGMAVSFAALFGWLLPYLATR